MKPFGSRSPCRSLNLGQEDPKFLEERRKDSIGKKITSKGRIRNFIQLFTVEPILGSKLRLHPIGAFQVICKDVQLKEILVILAFGGRSFIFGKVEGKLGARPWDLRVVRSADQPLLHLPKLVPLIAFTFEAKANDIDVVRARIGNQGRFAMESKVLSFASPMRDVTNFRGIMRIKRPCLLMEYPAFGLFDRAGEASLKQSQPQLAYEGHKQRSSPNMTQRRCSFPRSVRRKAFKRAFVDLPLSTGAL
ncbi:hypothetical protein VNO77_15269 [Canavalia gladiata]|uniref:Uncharacterized protein n=1 Tax=Canavalia gladiata TaxID=3824 RepID=A0AAN9M451_CANGL